MYNTPYIQPYPQKQEVVNVNGENGAKAYPLAPNSSAILLDQNNPIVYLVQTDGAGYKTVTPYDIVVHEPEIPVDVKSLEERINKLEAMINESNDAKARKEQPLSVIDAIEVR